MKSPRTRLFVALELPARVRVAIVEWGREALGDPALRPVAAESLHITLAFLGYRPEKEVQRLAEALESLEVPAPRIELRDPVPRPPRGRARLFALPVESPQAVEVQVALQEELVAAGLYEPEKRAFWPHVTVARARPERGSKKPMRVAEPPPGLPSDLCEHAFDVVRVTLYRSDLQPQGARYTPLSQIELPKGRQ